VAVSLMDKLGIQRSGTQTVPPALPRADAGSSPSGGAFELAIGTAMPDLRGTPKKLLLPLLLRKDLAVTINGSGFVAHQDPPPGARIQEGMKISLELQ
jgi:cell division protein FtsI (penicillin-binding protein 3)